MKRAVEAVAGLPGGFVQAGFSLGCMMGVHVAATCSPTRRCRTSTTRSPPRCSGGALPFVRACGPTANDSSPIATARPGKE